jgi:hypothetical protein
MRWGRCFAFTGDLEFGERAGLPTPFYLVFKLLVERLTPQSGAAAWLSICLVAK